MRPEFAAWPGRAILQYNGTQAYMSGRSVAILRKNLPPATFDYDGSTLTAIAADDELIDTAIAHADWSSTTYEQYLYRLPAEAARQRELVSLRRGAPQ
jgi:hypothetical protein